MLEVLARAIRQLKQTKGVQVGKEDVTVSLFADGRTVCVSDPKNSTKAVLQPINILSKEAGTKPTHKTLVAPLHTNDKETRETRPFTIASDHIKYQASERIQVFEKGN